MEAMDRLDILTSYVREARRRRRSSPFRPLPIEREAISWRFMIRPTSRQPFLGVDDLSNEYVKTELRSDDDENEQLGQTERYVNVMLRVRINICAYQKRPPHKKE